MLIVTVVVVMRYFNIIKYRKLYYCSLNNWMECIRYTIITYMTTEMHTSILTIMLFILCVCTEICASTRLKISKYSNPANGNCMNITTIIKYNNLLLCAWIEDVCRMPTAWIKSLVIRNRHTQKQLHWKNEYTPLDVQWNYSRWNPMASTSITRSYRRYLHNSGKFG